MSNELLSSDTADEITEPRRVRPISRRDALKPASTARPRRARSRLATVTRPHWLRPTADLAVVLIFTAVAAIFGLGASASSDAWPFLLCVLTATAAALYAAYHHVRSLATHVRTH